MAFPHLLGSGNLILDTAAKLQVLCHLANFAYDPINYVHLRDLGVISLFLGMLRPRPHTKKQAFFSRDLLAHRRVHAKFLATADCLGDGNEDPRFVEFAMAGLSNLALGNFFFLV